MLGASIAWLHKDKLNRFTEEDRKGFPHWSPDFVVEIDGPFDEPDERHEKVRKWLTNGVELVWLIGAEDRSAPFTAKATRPNTSSTPPQSKAPVLSLGLNW